MLSYEVSVVLCESDTELQCSCMQLLAEFKFEIMAKVQGE